MLADGLVEMGVVESISDETVRLTLKKGISTMRVSRVSSIRCKRPSHVPGILSPNMMANRLRASFQFWTGRVHLFEARCIAR